MNNILNITFEEGKIIAKAGGLWQWDRGQKIRIFGTGIKQDAEMHLSLMEKGGNSVTLRGVYDSNLDALIADIPDRYLGQDSLIDYKLYAFIYVRSDESSAETVYKIILNIKARPKPEGYDDDEGYIIKSGVGESTTGQNVTYSGTDYECGAGAERLVFIRMQKDIRLLQSALRDTQKVFRQNHSETILMLRAVDVKRKDRHHTQKVPVQKQQEIFHTAKVVARLHQVSNLMPKVPVL